MMIKKKGLSCVISFCMIVNILSGLVIVQDDVKVEAAATGFTQYDFLQTDGIYVKNNYGQGNNVYLRGTNLGNLFVQESWMSSTSATDQKTILETLTSRFGQDSALELLDYYESNYITESDLDNCQAMGMSVVRVPFTYMNLYKKSGNSWVLRDDAFDRLDWIVEECSKRGIYVILDLHGAFGSQNGQDHSGEVIENTSDVTFFYDEGKEDREMTLQLWKEVASHYKESPAVAAYDTLNEPGEKAGNTSERHWSFYDEMYDAIRSVDPDHIIIFESCWGTGNLPDPDIYGWENIMYEYHHYPWDYVDDTDANYQGQVSAIESLISGVNSAGYDVPTYIGEFNCFDGDEKWEYVLTAMNEAGWHYTNWSYKARGNGSWGIYHENAFLGKVDVSSDSYDTIKSKWSSSNIGTNISDTGVTYNNMKACLTGNISYADKALTDDDFVTLESVVNSKYVCAEDYGASNLVARSSNGDEWEQFRIIKNSDGTISFKSRANGNYLCAVMDSDDTSHPIIARSSEISDWEKFYLEEQSDGTYALRTYTNNYYVKVDTSASASGILYAISTSVSDAEKFTISAVSGASTLPMGSLDETSSSEDTTVEETTVTSTASVTDVPGTLNIESYSDKSSEITFTTSGDVTYAGQTEDERYLTYNINVTKAGTYNVNIQVAAGDGQWNADSIQLLVNDTVQAEIAVTGSSGWEEFIDHEAWLTFSQTGTYTFTIKIIGGSANLANITFSIKEDETTATAEESTTEEPTTENTSDIVISDDVKVVGYQISATAGGSRVVGSVEPKINGQKVTEWGFIYAITQVDGTTYDVSDDDMVIDSDNNYVAAMASTSAGTSSVALGDSDTATYFVRTTLFTAGTSKEYTSEYKVRVYAALADGSYVYSDTDDYNVYEVAAYLYENDMMNNAASHQYLYDNILTVVDPDYKENDFDWSNTIVKP